MSELWTPADTTTELWLDASDAATLTHSGGLVSAWTDKSGNGYSPSQSTSSLRPGFVAAGQNGLDVVSFNGSDERLVYSPSTALAQNVASALVFVVCKHDATPSSSRIPFAVSRGTTDTATRIQVAGSFSGKYVLGGRRLDGDGYLEINSTATIDTGWHLQGGAFDYSNSDLYQYIDGALDGSSTSYQASGNTSNTASLEMYVGAALTSANFFDGNIAEIILIHNDVSTAVRQKFEGYLAWKWGLEANLPGGHPYESAAPTIGYAEPTSGATTVTSYAPTVNVSAAALPSVGSATFTGKVPEIVRSVPVGAFGFFGQEPQIFVGVNVAVPAGTTTATGYAPTVGTSVSAAPGVGSTVFTGAAPTVRASDNKTITVPVGAALLTGRVPLAGHSGGAVPDIGAANFTGAVPIPGISGAAYPRPAEAWFTTYAPTARASNFKVAAVYRGEFYAVGYAPVVGVSKSATPTTGAATFTGRVPLVGFTGRSAVAVGAASFSGRSPAIALSDNQRAAPPSGSAAFTGFAPIPGRSGSAAPATGDMEFTGRVPGVYADPPDFSASPTPLTKARFVVVYPAKRAR